MNETTGFASTGLYLEAAQRWRDPSQSGRAIGLGGYLPSLAGWVQNSPPGFFKTTLFPKGPNMLKNLKVRLMNVFYSFRDDQKPRFFLARPANIPGILATDWGGDPLFFVFGVGTEAVHRAKRIFDDPELCSGEFAVDLTESGHTLDDFPLFLLGEWLEPVDGQGRLIADAFNPRAMYRVCIETGHICFSEMLFGEESRYKAWFSNPTLVDPSEPNPLAVAYVKSLLSTPPQSQLESNVRNPRPISARQG